MLTLRSRWTALFVCASLACAPPPKPTSRARAQTLAPRSDHTALIPRAVLFGDPERSEVRLSPDGRFVSWLAPEGGVLNIWVAPADDLERGHAVSAESVRPVQHYDWIYDSAHLVYSQDAAGDENFHLYRVPASGGDVTDLTPLPGTRAELYALSEQKPELAMVGLNARDPHVFDVYQLDLRNGHRELVLRNDQGYSAFQFDHTLTLRFAQRLLDDGSAVWFSRDGTTNAWVPYDRIAQEDALTTSLFGFDRSGASFFAMDSRGRNTGALVRVDASSKQSALLWVDARADINHVLFHPIEHTVQAALIDYDRPYWVSLDRDVQRDLQASRGSKLTAAHRSSPRARSTTAYGWCTWNRITKAPSSTAGRARRRRRSYSLACSPHSTANLS